MLITTYYMEKLYVFIEPIDTQDIRRFTIEILNHACQLKKNKQQKTTKTMILNVNQKSLLEFCKTNLLLMDDDENNTSYKYLFQQNFENLQN